MWNEWLFDSGAVSKAPDRVDLGGGIELENNHSVDDEQLELARELIQMQQEQDAGGDGE